MKMNESEVVMVKSNLVYIKRKLCEDNIYNFFFFTPNLHAKAWFAPMMFCR